MAILNVRARQVYNSCGNPTVEVDVVTNKGVYRTSVPSGFETDHLDAQELRDDEDAQWGGKGVLRAVKNINNIIGPALIKYQVPVSHQTDLDNLLKRLDGSSNMSSLGGNATTAVSTALAKAGAGEKCDSLYGYFAYLASTQRSHILPVPFMIVLSGGPHAAGRVALHDFMIVPSDAKSFSDAVRQGMNVHHAIKSLIIKRYGLCASNVGEMGSFGPALNSTREALDLIMDAIRLSGHNSMKIAIHCGAGEFYLQTCGKYNLDRKSANNDPSECLSYQQLARFYESLLQEYPIVSFVDPFGATHLEAWTYFAKFAKCQIVGDDLTNTSSHLIEQAAKANAASAAMLKISQAGSVSEAIRAAQAARSANWDVMVSQRFSDTEDCIMSDFAVGLGASQIYCGAVRSERTAKLNQLIRIEEELGSLATYAGNCRSFDYLN